MSEEKMIQKEVHERILGLSVGFEFKLAENGNQLINLINERDKNVKQYSSPELMSAESRKMCADAIEDCNHKIKTFLGLW